MSFIDNVVAIPPVDDVMRPHVGLLGRDFLQHVRFEYDGPTDRFWIIGDDGQPEP
jgi:hypothetical protein